MDFKVCTSCSALKTKREGTIMAAGLTLFLISSTKSIFSFPIAKITQTVEKKFNQLISDSISPKIPQLLPSSKSQKVLSATQLTNVLMQLETIVRQQIHVTLPDIQKTLKSSVDTQLKAQIKNLKLDIPGVLKIDVSAKVDIVSSVKTVVTSIYNSYADASIAIAVKSYIKGIQGGASNKKS